MQGIEIAQKCWNPRAYQFFPLMIRSSASGFDEPIVHADPFLFPPPYVSFKQRNGAREAESAA
jgi:hypothetical protein